MYGCSNVRTSFPGVESGVENVSRVEERELIFLLKRSERRTRTDQFRDEGRGEGKKNTYERLKASFSMTIDPVGPRPREELESLAFGELAVFCLPLTRSTSSDEPAREGFPDVVCEMKRGVEVTKVVSEEFQAASNETREVQTNLRP